MLRDGLPLLTLLLQAHLTHILVPLFQLRGLKIYLDLVGTPRLKPARGWRMIRSPPGVYIYNAYAVSDFERAVHAMAQVFAQNLSLSLREVIAYSVSGSSPYWCVYDRGELRLL